MKRRRIATSVLLIFLGLQVGVAWSAAMHGTSHAQHRAGDAPHSAGLALHDGADHQLMVADTQVEMASHCDTESPADHQASKGAPGSEECCQVECQCCVGHCHSSLAVVPASVSLYLSHQPQFAVFVPSPRVISQNRFRPPILA